MGTSRLVEPDRGEKVCQRLTVYTSAQVYISHSGAWLPGVVSAKGCLHNQLHRAICQSWGKGALQSLQQLVDN